MKLHWSARRAWQRYAVAILMVAMGAGAREALGVLGTHTPFITFYPAVMIVAWYGGVGAGLVAGVLSGWVASYWMETAGVLFMIRDPAHRAGTAVFLVSCVMISIICEAMGRARARATAAEVEACLAGERARGVEALRESEGQLRALFEQAAVGMAVVDPATGRFRQANAKYCEITGYGASELLGMTFGDVTHPEDRVADRDRYDRLASGAAREYSQEKRYVRKDGRVIWVHVAVGMVRDAQGRAVQSVGVIQEITEQKRAADALRESKERLSRSQAIAHLGSWELDLVRGELMWSDEVYRIFGLEPQEFGATYEAFLERVHPEDRGAVDGAYFGSVREGRDSYEIEHRVVRKRSGEIRWVREKCEHVRDGGGRIIRSVGMVLDVTERKRWEEALREAKEGAEAASQAKDRFLAVLSHELRTPLTPVLVLVSMLQDDRRLDEDLRQSMEMIRRNVEMEARLIDDLLDVTRIAQGKVELDKRPIELCTIINRAVEVCRSDIEDRGLGFGVDTGDGPYMVEGDAVRLQQVFWNLLKNAIKFTAAGGYVGIRCRRDGDGQVVAEVTDNGVGIEADALLKVFDAFEQGQRGVTRQFGGLGLGLTISKTLVEMHGGSIEAKSDGKGRGATFVVKLPIVSCELPAGVAEPSGATGGGPVATRSLRILLVEDHGDSARIMARLLEASGHGVATAGDVATALKLAGEREFDLLVSDLGLPDGSGLDLMRALRGAGSPIKGIAVSGYGQEQDIKQSQEAGFIGHLIKPVNTDALFDMIARAVEN